MRICRGGSYRSAPFKWFLGAEETRTQALFSPTPPSLHSCSPMLGWWIVERVTNGRLPRQVVPLKNPLERFNREDILVDIRARAGPNEPSSLVGSAANYVVLFGSNAMRRTQEVARKRGKGKLNLDRRVSFYVCKVRYPCCLRKKCLYLVRSACQNLSIFDPFNETERFEVESRWK